MKPRSEEKEDERKIAAILPARSGRQKKEIDKQEEWK
jgi:hypothetical protein